MVLDGVRRSGDRSLLGMLEGTWLLPHGMLGAEVGCSSAYVVRNEHLQIIGGSLMMKNKVGGQEITAATGRIAPDRRWFGNTRVISQQDLDRCVDRKPTSTIVSLRMLT